MNICERCNCCNAHPGLLWDGRTLAAAVRLVSHAHSATSRMTTPRPEMPAGFKVELDKNGWRH